MTKETQIFFEAITTAAGPLVETMYETVDPLHGQAAVLRGAVAELRLKLARADRTEEDVGTYAKFERFLQTFDALERELGVMTRAAQAVTDLTWQLNQYGTDVPAEIANAPVPVTP